MTPSLFILCVSSSKYSHVLDKLIANKEIRYLLALAGSGNLNGWKAYKTTSLNSHLKSTDHQHQWITAPSKSPFLDLSSSLDVVWMSSESCSKSFCIYFV